MQWPTTPECPLQFLMKVRSRLMENLVLDSTAISSYLQCQRRYQLAHIENLVPQEAQPHFDDGTVGHKLLEIYYRTRKDGTGVGDSVNIAIATTEDWLKTQSDIFITDERLRFLFDRFRIYCSFYHNEDFHIVDTEVGFSIEIFRSEKALYILDGKIDLVALDNQKRLMFVDHKYQGRGYELYNYNVQFLNYAIACNTNYGMINYIGLQKNIPTSGMYKGTHFVRKPIHFSPGVLAEWRMQLISIFNEISNKTFFAKNRAACKCGLNRKCQFTHICEQTNPGFESEIKRLEFKTREWTPWSLEEEGSDSD